MTKLALFPGNGMKYKAKILQASWKIRNIKSDRIICKGPTPQDHHSGIRFGMDLTAVLKADNDQSVRKSMHL